MTEVKNALTVKTLSEQVASINWKSSTFAKQMTALAKSIDKDIETTWKRAFIITNMLASESWKDDFKTQGDFAKFIGIDNSMASRYKKACEYLASSSMQEQEIMKKTWTLKRACLYARFKKTEKDDFETWVRLNNKSIASDSKLETALKEWRSSLKGTTEEEEKEEQEEVTEKAEKPVTKATAKDTVTEDGENMVTVKYGKEEFKVTMKAWQAFMKKYNG